MSRPGWGAAALLVVTGLSVGACGGDGRSPDPVAFCRHVTTLDENDPFAELDVASAADMRAAFAELDDAAGELAGTAPDEIAPQADRWVESIDALRDLLAGAGYDPRRADPLEYSRATERYESLARRIESFAATAC